MSWRIKWTDMSWYRRGLLILLAAMVVGFGIANGVLAGRMGLAYRGGLLYPAHQGETRHYSGTVEGKDTKLTITPDGVVTLNVGDWSYGPYQVTDLGEEDTERGEMNKVLVTRGDEVLFCGYCRDFANFEYLYDENLEPHWNGVGFSMSASGVDTAYIINGEEVSEQEFKGPSVKTLIRWALGPEKLSHRGDIGIYLASLFLAVLAAVMILFPEQLFRLSLWGHVRNIDDAEPSELYMFSQGFGWLVLTIVVFMINIMNLNTIS